MVDSYPLFPKPGTIYIISEPEFIGRMPVRQGPMMPWPPRTGPSLGELEFTEHGSIALRLFCGVDSDIEDNTIDSSWTLVVGGSVLVRGKTGGFYMTELEKDAKGWYVTCGDHKPRVTFDERRGRWVTTELV